MEIVNVVIAALFMLVVIYIIAQVLLKPIKLVWKVLLNSVIGLILLLVFNYIGSYFSFSLPINFITVLITGFLGIPGLLLLICFQILL